ncbi:MAG: hypothetical protein KIS92_26665, partial [Planctomycetota bacterium]|nr:hypothetical protein [Planctomycetota bacterium]
ARAIEQGGDLYRSAADAVNSLGSWQSPEAEELLREMSRDGDETVLWALYQYRYDEEAFRALLRGRLADHLGRPAQIEAELRLATLLSNRGLSALAIKHLESVLRRSPNHAQALDRLASAYGEAGRYAESDAAYARLEALEGVNATYLNNRAWFYCTAFDKEYLRPEPSLTMAQRAVALSPHSTYIVDTLGWANHVSGKYAEALKHLRRAQDLKEGADLPGIAWERTRVARTLAAMGKKDEALAETARALEEAPRDARTLVEAAGFYAAAGERDRSVDCLHKAIDAGWLQPAELELNPEFAALRQDQGYQYAVERARRACARMERIVAELEAALLKEHKLKHGDAPPVEEEDEEAQEDQEIGDWLIAE